MTFQKDQIQALIADIDGVLQKTTPRLPWVMSGEVAQQRQVLERVRNYLVALQRRAMTDEGFGQPGVRTELLAHDIYYRPSGSQAAEPVASSGQESAQQLLQVFMQEMGQLRASVMQPLQADVEGLRQQREALVQELRQLEMQRQNYLTGSSQNQQLTVELMQILLTRLQENLSQQMAQALGGSASGQALPYGANAFLGSGNALPGTAYPSLEQLRSAQAQSDQMLVNFDASIRLVFEALQKDIKAYQESLAQGIDKMHNLGQQGEMMFTALVNHLAQQLGREASSYMQAGGQTGAIAAEPARVEPILSAANPAPLSGIVPSQTGSSPAQAGSATNVSGNLPFPFPGMEMPSSSSVSSEPSIPGVDPEIDSWLQTPDNAELNLDDLDLESVAGTTDMSHLLAAPEMNLALESSPDALPDLSGLDLSSDDLLPATSEDTADIDAALKLLEQLSSELQTEPAPASLADAEAQLNRVLGSSAGLATEDEIPEEARDELDEFYESLFGAQAVAPEVVMEADTAPAAAISEAAVSPVADVTPVADLTPVAEVMTDSGVEFGTGESLSEDSLDDLTLGWQLAGDEPLPPEARVIPLPEDLFIDGAPLEVATANVPDLDLATGSATIPSDGADAGGEMAIAAGAESPVALEFDPADGDEVESLADLFDDLVPEAEPMTEPEADFVEVAGSPSEVVTGAPATPRTPSEGLIPPELGLSDDRYTPASPEEDLLPLDEALDLEENPSLWINESTFTRLSQDLFNLEGGEPAVTAGLEEPSLVEDWNDSSLDDFAAALPEVEAPGADLGLGSEMESGTASVENAFTLEGMDDLFVDTPAPAVDPTPPPAMASPPTVAFTLEGMDDLFSDIPAPPSIPVPPPSVAAALPDESLDQAPGEPMDLMPGLLEGMDDLLGEAQPTEAIAASEPAVTSEPEAASSAEPATFTLEGMDDLFSELTAPTLPDPTTISPASETTFTLEGMDDLFIEAPTMAGSIEPPAREPSPTGKQAILDNSLEGFGDFFGEVPPVITDAPVSEEPVADPIADLSATMPTAATISGEPPDSPEPAIAPTGEFTLEQVGDLFMEVPAGQIPAPPASLEIGGEPAVDLDAFTLEQVGDLFMEVPASQPISQPTSQPAETQTAMEGFTLEQVEDLFADVPATEMTPPGEPPEVFTMEQVEDLFADVPATETTPPGEPAQTELSSLDDLSGMTLDQAFESLLGASGIAPVEPSPSTEKKKNPE